MYKATRERRGRARPVGASHMFNKKTAKVSFS